MDVNTFVYVPLTNLPSSTSQFSELRTSWSSFQSPFQSLSYFPKLT